MDEAKSIAIQALDSAKSAHKRIDEQGEKLENLSNVYVALTKVDDKVNNVVEDVSEIKCDMKEIKDKPNKILEKIGMTIIACIVTAVITFLLAKLGLKEGGNDYENKQRNDSAYSNVSYSIN